MESLKRKNINVKELENLNFLYFNFYWKPNEIWTIGYLD